MRQATLTSLYLYYSFWSRGISLCLLDHLGNLFGYEQKGHFEHPLLWVHSVLGYTLDSDWFLFPFQSLSFMGDWDVAVCLLLFLSAKKQKVNRKSDSFYWECVCILQDFREKKLQYFRTASTSTAGTPTPSIFIINLFFANQHFFVDQGSPQNWCGGLCRKPKWTKKKKKNSSDGHTSKKINLCLWEDSSPRCSLPPRAFLCQGLCLLP